MNDTKIQKICAFCEETFPVDAIKDHIRINHLGIESSDDDTGSKSLEIYADFASQNAAAAGNLLANSNIPKAMVTAFHQGTGHLGDRLIDAMRVALALGGEAGALHSAGLLLVGEQEWPMADLRCDWTEDCPIEAVAAAWHIYKPQIDDYVTRALDPAKAPSYGVPGDE